MSAYKPFLCFCLSLFLLSACSSLPKSQIPHPDWQIHGKLGIRSQNQAGSLLFNWQQKGAQYLIHLMDPLGRALLNLAGNKKQVLAITKDGTVYRADNAEELLLGMTGWYFPVEDVKYWLQGQNHNRAYASKFNEKQQLIQIDSPDWQVTLSRYQNVDGHLLPHLLRLKNIKQNLTLTVVIKQHAYFKP